MLRMNPFAVCFFLVRSGNFIQYQLSNYAAKGWSVDKPTSRNVGGSGLDWGLWKGHYSGVVTETLVPLPGPLFHSVSKRRRSLVQCVWGCRMRRRVAGRGRIFCDFPIWTKFFGAKNIG
ncbi:hypothetical protein BDP55DRAFT_205683 [Colletotrichum godetiae]|uniref:Uncharacterized protein n=1 Tax=Colletotrichum godetiae TaxID=1209918 RepID=A0AAJ0AZC2_9PEZI|nr:uncharacterized protein BDP55DRAFT_205683 [Colletotrichum godetiae]KAK1699739.1 hypothetical protein BDP55DRAFT_205683 [Colletotrichum godetiae]